MKIISREPTQAMIEAASRAWDKIPLATKYTETFRLLWQAMYDAAPFVAGPNDTVADTRLTRDPIDDRCPYCSFDPTSMSDYCDKHRPKL